MRSRRNVLVCPRSAFCAVLRQSSIQTMWCWAADILCCQSSGLMPPFCPFCRHSHVPQMHPWRALSAGALDLRFWDASQVTWCPPLLSILLQAQSSTTAVSLTRSVRRRFGFGLLRWWAEWHCYLLINTINIYTTTIISCIWQHWWMDLDFRQVNGQVSAQEMWSRVSDLQ